MGFYEYFKLAKTFCPTKLKPFSPAIYYEVARTLQSRRIYLWGMPRGKIRDILVPYYNMAYDRIVERMGDKIAEENYILATKKHVSGGDKQA